MCPKNLCAPLPMCAMTHVLHPPVPHLDLVGIHWTHDPAHDHMIVHHQNLSKILSIAILRVFDDLHMWCQNWCQYVWTSLYQFINFFVNLLHSPAVWFFVIWHLFDIWHIAYYLNHLSPSQGYFIVLVKYYSLKWGIRSSEMRPIRRITRHI